MTNDLGKLLLEAMDAMPDRMGTPTRKLFMYQSEYDALDKACQDQFGQTLPQYLGDHWKPTIISSLSIAEETTYLDRPSVNGEMMCYFESPELYDACQTQSWYARLWMRYARFCAYIREKSTGRCSECGEGTLHMTKSGVQACPVCGRTP